MTLAERGVGSPIVSLSEFLRGERPPIGGRTDIGLERYVDEILASGFPGIHGLSPRLLRARLDGYLDRIVDRDLELGREVRRPATLRRWMQASRRRPPRRPPTKRSETPRAGGVERRLAGDRSAIPRRARTSLDPDPLPAWLPTRNRLARLASPFKRRLADPALAARLLGVDGDALLHARPAGPPMPREGTLLGALFESLVTLCVRVYAQAAEARTAHLRTWSGDREIDLIVERGKDIVALEVKLGQVPDDGDVRHLLWLQRQRLGADLKDAVVITTGQAASGDPTGSRSCRRHCSGLEEPRSLEHDTG